MTENNNNTEYLSKPRGIARIQGIDLTACDLCLDECNQYFLKHVDETDYRNLDIYLQRSQLRFATGDDMIDVLDDLFLAARCLHERAAMHLELKPPEMFITRRVLPVEIGILSGMPMLTMEFAATYGLPLMMIFAKEASEDLISEACLLSTCFRRHDVADCKDFYELYGLAAGIYAGAIAAIGRGFDDEAMIGINAYLRAREARPLQRMKPPASIIPKLNRYDDLLMALGSLCTGKFENIGSILADAAENFAIDNIKRAGSEDKYLKPAKSPLPKYFDTGIVTVLALAALRDNLLPLPTTGYIAPYASFTQAFLEIPERRIEVPGLNEEARQILEQAGINPDELANQGMVDNSFESQKEEAERKALELLQQRQRAAQDAIRKKIAEEAQNPEENNVTPENFEQEKLKLHENDDQIKKPEKKAKDFSNFFQEGDDDSQIMRDHFKESEDNSIQTVNKQDFAAIFSQDEHNYETQNQDDELNTNTLKSVPFKDFFANNDENDDLRRSLSEEENKQLLSKTQNFTAFFDNLDESTLPHFDDGSQDENNPINTFSPEFFNENNTHTTNKITSDDLSFEENSRIKDFTQIFTREATHQLSDLKMKADTPEEPLKPVENIKKHTPKPTALPEGFDDLKNNHKSFSPDFFSSSEIHTTDLKMSEDNNNKSVKIQNTQKYTEPNSESEEIPPINQTKSRFSQDFFNNDHSHHTDLKMSEENNTPLQQQIANAIDEDRRKQNQDEDYTPPKPKIFSPDFFEDKNKTTSNLKMAETKQRQPNTFSQDSVDEDQDTDKQNLKSPIDYKNFFDKKDEQITKTPSSIDLKKQQEEQLQELAKAQAEKARLIAEQNASLKLELEPEDEENTTPQPESRIDTLQRRIREKDHAAREAALKMREQEQKERSELAAKPTQQTPSLQLQLTPTKNDDEEISISQPDDLTISPYAYTELDMIHDNTAIREEQEEDITVLDALKNITPTKEDNLQIEDNDDDLHVKVQYDDK